MENIALKYRFSTEEKAEISKLLDEITKEIITDLQCQYDYLKTLDFIDK